MFYMCSDAFWAWSFSFIIYHFKTTVAMMFMFINLNVYLQHNQFLNSIFAKLAA